MKCAQHPEVDSVGYCRQCGKGLCADCRRDVKGVIYCEDCLAASVLPAAAPAAAAPPPGAPNPGIALALGFLPGVGAIYNGEYIKALFHLLIFGGLISLGDQAGPFEALFAMLAVGFYFYMVIDSYQTARRRAAGLAPAPAAPESFGLGDAEKVAPIGPLILIVLGALFLMKTLGFFPLVSLSKFWPVILIAIGVWMLWKRAGGESR